MILFCWKRESLRSFHLTWTSSRCSPRTSSWPPGTLKSASPLFSQAWWRRDTPSQSMEYLWRIWCLLQLLIPYILMQLTWHILIKMGRIPPDNSSAGLVSQRTQRCIAICLRQTLWGLTRPRLRWRQWGLSYFSRTRLMHMLVHFSGSRIWLLSQLRRRNRHKIIWWSKWFAIKAKTGMILSCHLALSLAWVKFSRAHWISRKLKAKRRTW